MKKHGTNFSSQFRFAAPYIRAHRDKTFVVGLPSDAIESENFQNLVHDLTLLSSLGIRLVIVHGSRLQIEKALAEKGQSSQIVNQIRVTPENQLETICSAIHQNQDTIIRTFSRGMSHTPGFGLQNSVISGNFVTARPLGIKGGTDYLYTGQVRLINHEKINTVLNSGSIVLVSTLGYSFTGEVFNLSIAELTTCLSQSLNADKLICFANSEGLADLSAKDENVFNIGQMENILADQSEPNALIQAAVSSVNQGMERAHIIDFESEGALLEELFTPQGSGLMVVERDIEKVRTAKLEDIGGILKLIQPLENSGQLIRRDKDSLEQQIDCFRVIDIDGMIIACAAIFTYTDDKLAELACLAIHPNFQNGGRGAKLVQHIEHSALSNGLDKLVSLTTEGAHWFIGHGFEEIEIHALPKARQELYDSKRASKIFIKSLKAK